MDPRHPVRPLGVDRPQLLGGAAVGQHRPLATGLDEDDDRAGRPAALHAHVDADGRQPGSEVLAGGVVADTSDEADRAAGERRRGGDVGAAATR